MHHHARLTSLVVLVLANIAIAFLSSGTNKEGVLTVAFLDVGQGDAIFIETPTGKQMLIDGGSSRAASGELGRRMSFFDRSIDIVLNTHPDLDHIGGLPDVLEHYTVGTIIDSGVRDTSDAFVAYETSVQNEGARRVEARRGHVIDFGDGVTFTILFPDRDMDDVSDTNDASVIGRLVYGETEALLSGDAPSSVERYLVELDGEILASDILKAGHHGSKTSTDAVFLATVAPTYAVISAGKDNRYGHPHADVVERLRKAGAEIITTYDKGTIVFESDGTTLTLAR